MIELMVMKDIGHGFKGIGVCGGVGRFWAGGGRGGGDM